ncbi:MAG: hypothetical protein LBQ60_05880 [Bacteroidales bacterium]|jgi:hypothetical protein|nr:hypothetical protein [Bacteroidales bacterium]
MKKIKWTKRNILIWGMLTVFAFIVIKIASRSIENDVKSLLENCEYTVGTVKVFFIPNKPPDPYLRYKYYVDGTEIEGREYHNLVLTRGMKGAEVDERYIVAYSKKNVKESVMLFKYPIKQAGDFEKYLEEFKINPPR